MFLAVSSPSPRLSERRSPSAVVLVVVVVAVLPVAAVVPPEVDVVLPVVAVAVSPPGVVAAAPASPLVVVVVALLPVAVVVLVAVVAVIRKCNASSHLGFGATAKRRMIYSVESHWMECTFIIKKLLLCFSKRSFTPPKIRHRRKQSHQSSTSFQPVHLRPNRIVLGTSFMPVMSPESSRIGSSASGAVFACVAWGIGFFFPGLGFLTLL